MKFKVEIDGIPATLLVAPENCDHHLVESFFQMNTQDEEERTVEILDWESYDFDGRWELYTEWPVTQNEMKNIQCVVSRVERQHRDDYFVYVHGNHLVKAYFRLNQLGHEPELYGYKGEWK